MTFEDKFHQEVDIHEPLCYSCAHWVENTSMCKAYPNGILRGILSRQLDHTQEQPGDRGVRYSPMIFKQK